MVVNKKNWSPWHHSPPPPAAGAKKFRVKVERIKLEGFEHGTGGGEKVMGVELRWKGERKHGLAAVGFHRRRQELRWCKERTVRKGEVIVWEEDDELENVCLFSETSAIGGEIDGHKFVPWIVTLKLTYGEYMKGKMSKIGKVSLDLAEFVSKIESPVIEKKLPVDLMVSGLTTQATISVLLSFVEIRDSGEFDSESTQLEDLETVLRARIRPLTVSRVKSFVGFFSPEKFDSLTGVMSFDDIWDREISRNLGVYIVSWNDHFFVLKVDEDGYYVIDTLGERLVEGCEQAYILRFDNGSSLTESGTDQVVCKGKECCKGFIKKFLAAIPLKELETEERKQAVPYYSLHHRLQIEFNFCSMV
ncbi:putative NT-type C2 domain-containing protein [Helianthus annuus]|nr:putative NT-type C2 domain-containing protein [Helianthus annuus]